MIILGINEYHGDASAAIIVDGKLVAAAEEERFNRIKHSSGFPFQAVGYCLKQAGVSIKEVDYIALPRDSKARILRKRSISSCVRWVVSCCILGVLVRTITSKRRAFS